MLSDSQCASSPEHVLSIISEELSDEAFVEPTDDLEAPAPKSDSKPHRAGSVDVQSLPSVKLLVSSFNKSAGPILSPPSAQLLGIRPIAPTLASPAPAETAEETDLVVVIDCHENVPCLAGTDSLDDSANLTSPLTKPSTSLSCSLLPTDSPEPKTYGSKNDLQSSTGSEDGPWWQRDGMVVTFKVCLEREFPDMTTWDSPDNLRFKFYLICMLLDKKIVFLIHRYNLFHGQTIPFVMRIECKFALFRG